MMAATAIMATVTASVVVVMRIGLRRRGTLKKPTSTCWKTATECCGTLSRQLRQATAVTAITAAGNTHGQPVVHDWPAGVTRTWARNASSDVYFNNGTSNQLLAKSINSLTFTGYKADGVTATTTVTDIQVVQCQVQITLPRGAGVTRTLTTRAWIRSW